MGWFRSRRKEPGTLLDAKGPGLALLLPRPWFERGRRALLEQAQRQLLAAGETPLEWHVAEEDAARLLREFLRRGGCGRIAVVYDPPMP